MVRVGRRPLGLPGVYVSLKEVLDRKCCGCFTYKDVHLSDVLWCGFGFAVVKGPESSSARRLEQNLRSYS
jgi:hypothetical protein